MKEKEIKILQSLCLNESISKKTLKKIVGLKDWQLNVYLRHLEKQGYISNNRDHVRIIYNKQSKLFKKMNQKYDLKKLLINNNDTVLKLISQERFNRFDSQLDVDFIIRETNLSRATVYRALAVFEEMGIIQRQIAVIFAESETIEILK